MAEYEIGDQFFHKVDKTVTGTIGAKRVMNGITHYHLLVQPNPFRISPDWISEYGIRIDFEKKQTQK